MECRSECFFDESSSGTRLHNLPVEIHAKILMLLDPVDVLAYAQACKLFQKYADSQQLWKHQWSKLSVKTPFVFPPPSTLVELGANFKDACRRLWKVLVTEGSFGGLNPSKCVHCREYTCGAQCIEARTTAKVSMDIGGKMTWLVTSSYTLKRHLSMIAVPKVLKCYDCDTTIARDEYRCDCVPGPRDLNPSLRAQVPRAPYCHNRLMSSHTALEYCSQPLADIWVNGQPSLSQPFCLFCDEDKVNRMLCEREMVSSTRHKMKSVRPPFMSVSGEEEFLNYAAISPLTNGYCRDTASILGAHNLDLLSPLLAMEHEDAFPIVESFLTHLLKQNKMIEDLQRPNSSIILTVPSKLPHGVKEALLRFFFEDTKTARLCLLPKALAISQLFEVNTCVVVDSGATSTSVWVVVDGKVDECKSQTMSVGGWHVSQFLKQALTWRDNKDAAGATVSSLDTSAVKQKCRLSLNLSREGTDYHRGLGAATSSSRTETLHIKSQRDSHRRLELTEVTLSSELYLAPEMMYASLDLPGMVNEATKDLPDHLVKECFSHILVTGGNTDLQGFVQRFSSDLRELLPEHSPIINVCPYPTGNHSWNTVMGAHAVNVPIPYENVLHLYDPGSPLWLTREEYIVFGSQQLAMNNPLDREG